LLLRTNFCTAYFTGTNRRSLAYTAPIQSPLIKRFVADCARQFVAGTIELTNSNAKAMLINYDPSGTAACDNSASVMVNGHTRTIYFN
jgi:hypothetical protein